MTNTSDMIMVFGSNESGIHGAGAARFAMQQRGAQYGCSYGHTGDAFAIPTKNKTIRKTLEISHIRWYVLGFIAYAMSHPEMTFQVTRIGCGLAGLKDSEVAPLFLQTPSNCYFDTVWKEYLGDAYNYWGTF